MVTAEIVQLLKKPSFRIGMYSFVNQDPTIISVDDRVRLARTTLPCFVMLWSDIEASTGYRWRNTSLVRDSPSHRKGHSMDLAPDIAEKDKHLYAVNNNSDPVLWKRLPLIKDLTTLRNNQYAGPHDFGIFIESDHLHIQILEKDKKQFPISIVKWGEVKPVYSDSISRVNLPNTNKGYLPLR